MTIARRIALLLAMLLIATTIARASEFENQQVMQAGDSFSINGSTFQLLDAGKTLALFQITSGNYSSVFFIPKNQSTIVAGVTLLVQDYGSTPGKVVVFFSTNQTQSLLAQNQTESEKQTKDQTSILNASTLPSLANACIQQQQNTLAIEKQTQVYLEPSTGRVFSLIQFTVKNQGSTPVQGFSIRDSPSGREFAVEGLAPFEQKSFSFTVAGNASTQTQPPQILLENATGTSTASTPSKIQQFFQSPESWVYTLVFLVIAGEIAFSTIEVLEKRREKEAREKR